MKRLVLAAFLCVSMSGCSLLFPDTPVVNGQSVSSTNPAISKEAQKILTATHIAYNALGQALIDNAKAGVIHGTTAIAAKKWYDKAGDALLVADSAETASNETSLFAAVSEAKSAIAQAKTLLGMK